MAVNYLLTYLRSTGGQKHRAEMSGSKNKLSVCLVFNLKYPSIKFLYSKKKKSYTCVNACMLMTVNNLATIYSLWKV